MKKFLDASCARPEKHYVIPLILGKNRLELQSFIQLIMERRRCGGHIVIDNEMPSMEVLDRSNLTTAIFTRGERLSTDIQRGFVSGRFQHLRGVIVVLERNPLDTETPSSAPPFGWRKSFLEQCCTAKLTWPSWSKRSADHKRIFAEIHNRLNVPEGRKKPGFDGKVAELLGTWPLKGTDDAERFMKEALTRYIRSGENRDLTVHDFIPPEHLNAVSSARQNPDLPAVLQSA